MKKEYYIIIVIIVIFIITAFGFWFFLKDGHDTEPEQISQLITREKIEPKPERRKIDGWPIQSEADLDTTPENVTLTIPAICRRAHCGLYSYYNSQAATAWLYWKTTGQIGTTGHNGAISGGSATIGAVWNNTTVFTNTSQQITIWHSSDGSALAAVRTSGFYLPRGL